MRLILRTNTNESKHTDRHQIHQSFFLGISKNLINYPIDVSIDSFFNIHSAVLGNSGSGKSNSIAHIIQEIHKKENYSATGSRILIFDVNGEYKQAFINDVSSSILIKYYKPNIKQEVDGYIPFYLPHFLLSLDEWSAFLLATDATQRPFWDKVLQESYRFYRIGNSNKEEQNKFVNYLRYRICNLIFSTLRQADSDTARITTAASILGSITSIINSNHSLQNASDNPDCEFMRESNGIDSVKKYIAELWGNDEKKSQLVIIDTSELSPDILETLTSVTSRLLFDERKKLIGNDRRKNPVHLVLDEAHQYIKKHYDYLLKENIFEKIAREGRKYSFYLLVSSQRPSELSETVLSQCANFIVHRIQNEKDMHYIQAILPYFSDDFTNKIKQSIPGEALVFGNCVSMPLHLKIHESKPSPNSENCKIPEEWFKKKGVTQ
jgi:hypothetical protein